MEVPPDLERFMQDLRRYKELREQPLSLGETAAVIAGAFAIMVVIAYLGMAVLK